MTQSIIIGAVSTSSSTMDKKDLSRDIYMRWESLKNFVVIASAYIAINYNLNLYTNRFPGDSIYSYLLLCAVIGMPYMYMDYFIKQYTGRVDFASSLNPLLKSLNYGTIIISMGHCVLHATDLGGALGFLISCFKSIQPWAECSKILAYNPRAVCVPTYNVTILCKHNYVKDFSILSSVHYYKKYFQSRQDLATSIVLTVVSWISIFFISTIPDYMQVKVFYLSFIIKIIGVCGLSIYALSSAPQYAAKAIVDMFNFRTSDLDIIDHVGYARLYSYGIGIVGLNDFGVISPFVMTGNALALLFSVELVLLLVKVLGIHIVKNVVNRCMEFYNSFHAHQFIFKSIPSYADFFYCQRLILLSFYASLVLNVLSHLVAMASSITRMLHTDFKNIKEMYITGVICFIGCLLSGVLQLQLVEELDIGLLKGAQMAMTTIGCLKSAIVFYVYGISKFSTDIHFWLSYKPSRYYSVSWALLPIVLALMTGSLGLKLWRTKHEHFNQFVVAAITYSIIMLMVIILAFRTIIKFIVSNQLGALFKANVKYGPPEPEDRRRRRKYNEALTERTCTHGCNMLDDKIECNHKEMRYMQLLSEDITGISGGEPSVLQIFESPDLGRKSTRVSEMMDFRMN